MSFHHETERREFVRIQTAIPVRYKFLSRTIAVDSHPVYEGTTADVSAHGLLLIGKIPTVSWIPALLMQEIVLGLNLLIPALDSPVKALARVAWVESFQKGTEKCSIGLRFTEIQKEHQDELLKYVIKLQIAH